MRVHPSLPYSFEAIYHELCASPYVLPTTIHPPFKLKTPNDDLNPSTHWLDLFFLSFFLEPHFRSDALGRSSGAQRNPMDLYLAIDALET